MYKNVILLKDSRIKINDSTIALMFSVAGIMLFDNDGKDSNSISHVMNSNNIPLYVSKEQSLKMAEIFADFDGAIGARWKINQNDSDIVSYWNEGYVNIYHGNIDVVLPDIELEE